MQQLIWISLALVLGGVVLLIDEDLFESGAPYLYIGFVLLLIVTAVVAPDIKGSRSWLVMGPVRVQPAEFAKLGTALMLAYWLNRPEFKLTTLRGYLEVFAIILLPMAIIILSGTVTPAPITAHARRIAHSSAFLAGISVILNCLPLSRLSASTVNTVLLRAIFVS